MTICAQCVHHRVVGNFHECRSEKVRTEHQTNRVTGVVSLPIPEGVPCLQANDGRCVGFEHRGLMP